MYVLGSRARDGKRAGPTIYELNAGREGRSAREIPRLVAAGLAITWHAGRRELITMAVLEVLSGVGVAAEVVVGRRVLEAILATQHVGSGSAGVGVGTSAGLRNGWQGMWPSAVLLGIITALLGLAGAVLREQERMLSELTQRYAQDRILDVTCAVELAAFDQPEFHDRVARAQVGVMRAPQLPCRTIWPCRPRPPGPRRSYCWGSGWRSPGRAPGCCRSRRCSSMTSWPSPGTRPPRNRVRRFRWRTMMVRSAQ
jgi:hypothetical protein